MDKYICITEFSLFPAISRTFETYEEADSFCIQAKRDGFRCRLGHISDVPEYDGSPPTPAIDNCQLIFNENYHTKEEMI